MQWINDNKDWLFSGLGVAIIGWFFIRQANNQVQKGGDNSKNIQVGGNLTIGGNEQDDK